MAIINIMKLKKQSSPQEQEANSRFLIKHSSSSILNMFGCCSSSPAYDYESAHLEKPTPHKISIKNVLKKSAIFGMNGSPSISESQYYQADKKEQVASPSSFNHKIRNSQISQVSGSLAKNLSERTIPKAESRKINFLYNQQQNEKSIHNYHTTNYIVERYIVKPQQMNIFLKNQQERPNNQPHDYPQRAKQQHINEQRQNELVPPPRNQQVNEGLDNCHFSFGGAQKKMFMNKFAGFREVSSNRPSKEAPKPQNQAELRAEKQADELPTFLSLRKNQNLNNLVRKVSVMDEQLDDSSSGASQVIDNYQTMMSRIQQNGGRSPHRFGNNMQ